MPQPSIGVIRFPGSNCDNDYVTVFQEFFDIELKQIWYAEKKLPSVQGLILPGGFSYGDYLRAGILAAKSEVMDRVSEFVSQGGAVIGVCNGFQILTESGLLPGTLLQNAGQNFVCEWVDLEVNQGSSIYHETLRDQTYRIPVAHGEGRYFIQEADFKNADVEPLFKYKNNPNGSWDDIAGIVGHGGRVMGMMPHPERAMAQFHGSDDGVEIWRSFLAQCT